MAKQELTDMQEKFCEIYAEHGNATQSAISAGYSENSASVTGSKLMKMAKINKRIAQIRQDNGLEVQADKDQVVERLLDMINDPKTEPQHMLTAIDKLSRIQGWLKDNATIEITSSAVDRMSDEELEKKLAELASNVVPMKKKA